VAITEEASLELLKTAIITATIGRPTLKRTCDSVQKQTVKCDHILVVDGYDRARLSITPENQSIIVRPHTGQWGGGCYRWAIENLNYDVFMFLDDDNWIESNHVESQLEALKGNDWAFTFRRVIHENGEILEERKKEKFVDTNCYAFKQGIAQGIASKFTADTYQNDRVVFKTLTGEGGFLRMGCTNRTTVNYEVRGEGWKPKK
jgi:hypothetical protein